MFSSFKLQLKSFAVALTSSFVSFPKESNSQFTLAVNLSPNESIVNSQLSFEFSSFKNPLNSFEVAFAFI